MSKANSADHDEDLPKDVVAPRSFVHYLGATWKVWRPNFGPAILTFFVVLLVTTLVVDLTGYLLIRNVFDDGRGAQLFLVGRFLLLAFAASLAAGITTVLFAGEVAGQPPTVSEARAAFRPSRRVAIFSALIASVLAFGAWLVFGPLGQITGPLLFLGPPLLMQVAVIERRRLNDSSLRMRELLKGGAARVLIYLLCAALMMGMLQVALIGPISLRLEGLSGAAIGDAVYALIGALTFSFMAAFTTIAYVESRTRTGTLEVEDLVLSPDDDLAEADDDDQ